MAKILLEIGADASQVESELQKMAGDMTKVNSIAKKTTSDISNGLKDVADKANKANKELENPKPTDNQKKQLSAIQQLKAEIKAYETAALKAGEGTAEFAKNIALAGQKKAELKDLKEAITALDPDAVAKSFLGLASSIGGGFAAAQGAIALVGGESEELNKTLVKLQATQAVLSGLQQLANAQDELGKVKIIFLNKLQELELRKSNAAIAQQIALTGAQSAEVAALTAKQELQIAATGKLSIAQRILNVIMASNPFLILVGVITAAVGAIALYAQSTERAARIEKIQSEALDGTIIKNKELRDAYNEHLIALTELQGKYAVLNGTMSEYEAAVNNINIKNKQAVSDINKETRVKLEEAGGFWNKLGNTITGFTTGMDLNKLEQETIVFEGNKKIQALEIKHEDELAKAKFEADEKKKNEAKKLYNDLLKYQKDFHSAQDDLEKKAEQAAIDQLDGEEKIRAIERQQLRELDVYKKSFIEKGKLTDKNFKLSADQEIQFSIIKNSIQLKANEDALKLKEQNAQALIDAENKLRDDQLAEDDKAFKSQLKKIEDHQKAQTLTTKEGSNARILAEIEEIQKVADFKKTQAGLSADEIIIIEREAAEKIIALQKQYAEKNKFSFAKLLGVSEEDLSKIKQFAGQILSSAKQIIDQQLQAEQDALDKRKQINDDVIKNNDDRLKSLQDQLNTELELHKQGFASNVALVQKEIDETNAAKQAALEESKRIAAEQDKIKKEQALSDSVTQISQLLSAGATLFAKGAFEGPIGIAVAVATIAGMFESFLALKQKLSAAGFKEGGYTGDIGENEIAGPAHGQEFVSNAKTTKKYRPLLEAMHTDNFAGLKLADIQPILEGAKFNVDVLNQIDNETNDYHQSKANHSLQMIQVMAATNKSLNKFFDHVKNKPEHRIKPNGDIEIKQGNTTRIIKRT